MTTPDVEPLDDDFDPFGDLEDREHLEHVADLRQDVTLDISAWASDPEVTRQVIQRAKAEKAKEKEHVPIPPPEDRWRPPIDELESCRSAKNMAAKAEKNGWSTRVLFGRGPEVSGRHSLGTRSFLLLGMARPSDRITARWRYHEGKGKWEFQAGFHWTPYRRQPGPNWVAITSPNINKLLESE